MAENIYLKRLKGYYELTKPKTVWLLVLVGAAAGLLLYKTPQFSWLKYVSGVVLLTLSVGGTNAFTCWIDRDIDAVMERTKKRPLAKGEISPRAALLFSISIYLLGVLGALIVNPGSVLYLILGFLFSAVLYNGYLKRRSTLNIIIASPAGMMPVLFMWHFLAGRIDILPLLLGLTVVAWTPSHIWSLALFFSRDYRKVSVPMLPVVKGERFTVLSIAAANLLLVFVTAAIIVYGGFSLYFALLAGALNAVLLYFTVTAVFEPSKENAWKLFKFSSPYLALIFLLALIDRLITQ